MPWDWAMPVLVGAAAFALGRRREPSAFDVLLLSVATFLALRARREVCNEYGRGSYLIWRLRGLPVSIDGRADLHGPGRIRRNLETLAGLQGWDRDPDLERANLLRLDPRFELVHEDPVAVVFVARRGGAGQKH